MKRPGFVYLLGRTVIAPIARLVYRPIVLGRKNVPRTGRVIFASNHLSFIDSIVIPLMAPRRVQFLAKSHYFEGSGVKGWLSRTFFTAIGAVGVERGAGQAAQDALEQSKRIIETGRGVRPVSRRGPARSTAGCTRAAPAWPGLRWRRARRSSRSDSSEPTSCSRSGRRSPASAGSPWRSANRSTSPGIGTAESGRARRQATDEIMAAIHELTGQELAGRYNEAPPAGAVERVKRAFRPERL